MKNTNKILIAIVLGVLAYSVIVYNNMISYRNNTQKYWSDVENQYQRRVDLYKNLAKTVKGYAKHEKSTLEDVIKARASATQMNIDISKATPEQLSKFQQAQQSLKSDFLSRLLVTVEKYPELKADKLFLELQSQLEGTENRITVARNRFNEKALLYKNYIERIPGVIFAKIFNFKPIVFFKSEKGAEKAPDIDLN